MKLLILVCSVSLCSMLWATSNLQGSSPKTVAKTSVEEAVPVEKPSCAGEGDFAGGSTLGALRCCPGLVLANWWIHQNLHLGCHVPPPPGTGGTCVKCGDGKCDKENYENKCNCPKDCKS